MTLFVTLILSLTSSFASSQPTQAGRDVVPNQYIVVLKEAEVSTPGATTSVRLRVSEIADRLSQDYGGRPEHIYKHALRGFATRMSARQARMMERDPRVDFIERDRWVWATTNGVGSWGLDRIDQRDLPLNDTYLYNSAGVGVNVYVIDTGIRTTHSEFEGRANPAFTAINDGGGAEDCNGHGTHVAGTIGGKTYGVAKGVTLHAVRVLRCGGFGLLSKILAGVDWVTGNHVKPAVANMSLASIRSPILGRAVKKSIAAGVIYAVAAGNNNLPACWFTPAHVREAITVGASTSTDERASFSNKGRCVDLFAPGLGITSAVHTGDEATASYSGTSMASPHVAGVAALYLQNHPTATPAEVEQAILEAATEGHLTDINRRTPNLLLYSLFDDLIP
jgi:subtilisin family serine protease